MRDAFPLAPASENNWNCSSRDSFAWIQMGRNFLLFLFVRVFVGRAFYVLRVVSMKKPDFFNKRIIKRRDDLRISRGCNYFHQTMHEILLRKRSKVSPMPRFIKIFAPPKPRKESNFIAFDPPRQFINRLRVFYVFALPHWRPKVTRTTTNTWKLILSMFKHENRFLISFYEREESCRCSHRKPFQFILVSSQKWTFPSIEKLPFMGRRKKNCSDT